MNFSQAVFNFFSVIFQFILDAFVGIWDIFREGVQTILDWISDFLLELIADIAIFLVTCGLDVVSSFFEGDLSDFQEFFEISNQIFRGVDIYLPVSETIFLYGFYWSFYVSVITGRHIIKLIPLIG